MIFEKILSYQVAICCGSRLSLLVTFRYPLYTAFLGRARDLQCVARRMESVCGFCKNGIQRSRKTTTHPLWERDLSGFRSSFTRISTRIRVGCSSKTFGQHYHVGDERKGACMEFADGHTFWRWYGIFDLNPKMFPVHLRTQMLRFATSKACSCWFGLILWPFSKAWQAPQVLRR